MSLHAHAMRLFDKNTMENNNSLTGYIHKLESFGLVDGPGVRFVIFMQGCSMRCKFCHNPETWCGGGDPWTAEALFKHVYRYRSYWKDNGGITVSGGEPLLQMNFVTELFRLAKKNGVHTAIDTSGQPFCNDEKWMSDFEQLMSVTDLVILDLKEFDSEGHKELTGFDNSNILQMAHWLSAHGKDMWIRHVLIPSVTDSEDDLEKMHEFISELGGVKRVEILPYHTLGLMKWEKLGWDYPLTGVRTPTAEEVKKAEQILHVDDYKA